MKFPPFLVCFVLCVAAIRPATADEVFIDPAAAGPDFALQGEYLGEGCAAQVVALGDGKFHIVGWSHGLPGAAADAERKVEADGQREGGGVTFAGGGWKGAIAEGALHGTNDDGASWELRKTERHSPTLGAKPPAGALVLFDGTNADAWQDGKLDPRGLLSSGTKSKQAFGDCTLHVEFRTPFRPAARGQARGNSGVYLQDRYEVQILDSFGLAGENNECGAIYTLHKPRVNMCFPPLSWQTYDIEFTAAHFDNDGRKTAPATATVRHNGVLIHDHVEISTATRAAGRPEGPEPGPIQLQGHGNPVFFQNIWIVENKAAPSPARVVAAAPAAGKNALPWDAMDLGPFQTGCFKIGDQITAKGIAIKIGTAESPATFLFDPELLRMSAAWTGGFVKFPRARGGLEGQIAADGAVKLSTGQAPGWSTEEIREDPRPRHQGHLPTESAKYRGLYLHGDQVVLSYTVGTSQVLELPGGDAATGAFTRTIHLGETKSPLFLLLADAPGATGTANENSATLSQGGSVLAAALGGAVSGAKFSAAEGRLVLQLPVLSKPVTFQVLLWSGPKADAAGAVANFATLSAPSLPDLAALTKGGPARWGATLELPGKPGTGEGPYVVDEISLPEANPYHSWLRPGGHDFLPNGDAVLVNLSGDVWLVSGLDTKLEHVRWKRIATGLFQPLGCRVVDGTIYVLGRDQITRLHDLNGDGESDFYECFNNDCIVTENYHEFALDLQTDSAGNFYYGKGSPWQPTNVSPHQGTMIRVSKDGTKFDIVCTGLRAPNGLGMGPNDFLTCSDNQGHWMPANRLDIIKPDRFYGMTPAAHKVLHFQAADGTEFDANPSSEDDRKKYKTDFWGKSDTPWPTEGYEPPLVWMPQNVDNSPGGEAWVTGGKWGPWEGRMLHTSYGKCLLYGVTMETVDGVAQGAVVRFPFKFPSGVMRARFSPADGQLYVSGLNVWQSDAAKFGCFSRVRYTGQPVTMPVEVHARKEGIELKFTGPLDAATAGDKDNYNVERWNYHWTGAYGSPDFKVSDPAQKGKDTVPVNGASLSADKTTVFLSLPDMGPCMQMRIAYKIKSADGQTVDYEIHNTIHHLPGAASVPQ